MKEAIGTTFVFNLIMIFTGIMIALLVGSIAYSKCFKIRNRMIDIIEKYNGYTNEAKLEIEENLSAIGYRIVNKACPSQVRSKDAVERMTLMEPQSNYHFCVYQTSTNRGVYYGVLVYMHFDIPIIGDWFEIPVYGETKTIFSENLEW